MNRTDGLHPWLYDRFREVELNPDNHLDCWARNHYKSTCITFCGTIQEILKNPEITIAIFSHTKDIACDFLQQIKTELDNNLVLQQAFPDVLWGKDETPPSGHWNLAQLKVKRKTNPKEATVEAHGLVDGMPTGKHFDLLIYDDVVTASSVNTPEQIEKTNAAWSLSDNLGSVNARKWHIGTRYHYADTYQLILDKNILIPRIYPATDNGTMYGNPVFLSTEQWENKKKTQSDSDLACQMLQDPMSGTDKMFNVKDVGVYQVRPSTLNIYIMVDPAKSKNIGSDNTAIAVIGVDMQLHKYLLDGFNHRMDLMERWQRTKDMYDKWSNVPGVQAVFVGYEKFSAQADLDYFEEQMTKNNERFDIIELAWPREGSASKKDRVQRLTPDFKQGKFWIPYPTKITDLTSEQIKMKDAGMDYRISKRIVRKDSENVLYDLSQHFLSQVNFFPHGGKVDLIDAVSRIYDMDIKPPFLSDYSEGATEPLYT